MSRKTIIWIAVAVAASAVTALLVQRAHRWRPHRVVLQGAVLRRDADTRRQLPIGGATVTASDGVTSVSAQSDASGYFHLTVREGVWPGQTVTLYFRAPQYKPLDMQVDAGLHIASRELYIAALQPIETKVDAQPHHVSSVVSNIRIRYTVNSQAEENVGSAVKAFQVVNQGNVPCQHRAPCSPDGLWKAVSGSAKLDAGPGNAFRNARASCIAGPCPFTRIDATEMADGQRTITTSALNWSDTATFLVEAEVFHSAINSYVRMSYPVVYGRALNFTLPPTQEGVSIEAEIDGAPMVFPLGPELRLSWATCSVRSNREGDRPIVYLCELKPGYRF